MAAKNTCAGLAAPALPETGDMPFLGKEGHFAWTLVTAIPEGVSLDMPQWCLPLFRQQAGSFESGLSAKMAGSITKKVERAKKKVSNARCIVRIVLRILVRLDSALANS